MRNKRTVGSCYEEKAALYLEEKGMRILERNFRCRTGEVDLIGQDGKYLVFVEVKYRMALGAGSAAEAVDRKKQRIISRVANFYLMAHCKNQDTACRFDVVAFEGDDAIHWYRNAFEYCP